MSDHEYVEGESVVTDEEILSFIGGDELPTYHTILEVWRSVLSNAETEKQVKVTAGYANRITTQFPQLKYSDMNDYRDAYFDKILELARVVDFEIETDEHCLTYTTPEEDVANNSHHYKNLLLQWQLCFVQWEIDWDCMDADAAIELAAISQAHEMFFGPTGITAYLDNIKFQFDEADQAEMAEAINELKASA